MEEASVAALAARSLHGKRLLYTGTTVTVRRQQAAYDRLVSAPAKACMDILTCHENQYQSNLRPNWKEGTVLEVTNVVPTLLLKWVVNSRILILSLVLPGLTLLMWLAVLLLFLLSWTFPLIVSWWMSARYATKLRESLYCTLGDALRKECPWLQPTVTHLLPEILRPVFMQMRWATSWWTATADHLLPTAPLVLVCAVAWVFQFCALSKRANMLLLPHLGSAPPVWVITLLMFTRVPGTSPASSQCPCQRLALNSP